MLIYKLNLEQETDKLKTKIKNCITEEVKNNDFIKETFLNEKHFKNISRDILVGIIAFLMRENDYKNYKKSILELTKENEYTEIRLKKENNKIKKEVKFNTEEMSYMFYDFLNKIISTFLYLDGFANFSITSELTNINIDLLNGTTILLKYKNNKKIKITLTTMDLYDIAVIDAEENVLKETQNLLNEELAINIILLKNQCF